MLEKLRIRNYKVTVLNEDGTITTEEISIFEIINIE